MKVEINSNGLCARLLVDGVDLGPFTRSFRIEQRAGELPVLTLELGHVLEQRLEFQDARVQRVVEQIRPLSPPPPPPPPDGLPRPSTESG